MIFYKAIRNDCLKTNLIPGTVTSNFEEAVLWLNRYQSKKRNGITRHIKQGKACIIQFNFDETTLLDSYEFQKAGIHEHKRLNCWTSIMKTKAQINTIVNNWSIVNY